MAIIFHVSKVSATYTCLNGGDHGGANWDPATDCPGGIAGNHTNIGTLTINTGETATVQAYSGTQYGSVQISATTVNINGTLTANAAGYAGGPANSISPGSGPGGGGGGGSSSSGGGGGYGGYGGFVNVGAAGVPNGSYSAPTSMGSGGGGGASEAGSAGGGAIQITASGTMTVGGTISTNGGAVAACSGTGGAGGAGGSIYLTAGSLAGSGGLTANGGSSGSCDAGGSGGRVALYYSSANTFSGSVSIAGGTAGSPGSTGTAITVNSTTNDLYINNSQIWHANPSFEGQTFTYNNVTVGSSATWNWSGYYTTNSNGVGITFNAANFTVSSGASISADGQGYAGGPANSISPGSGPGGGGGGNTGSGGGGGYGGTGGAENGAGGIEYGSYSAPVDLGSGGGGGNNEAGGAGGGAIKIVASGTLTVSGTISANGVSVGVCSGTGGAGGGGGSVYLRSKAFAGSGTVSAIGGNSGSCDASGGGGRIATYYSSTNTFNGTLSVLPGSAGVNGTVGTCIIVNSATNDLYITTSQTWNANPSLEGQTFTYNNVTVSNSATWIWNGYYTTNTNGVGMTFNVHNFTVASGSKLSADATGYAGGPATSSTPGSGPGGGGGGSTGSGGGGGYGGAGGFWGPGTAGVTYGSSTAPVDLGSGGGGGNNEAGGSGGGAIRIAASGTVSIVGTVSSNGGSVGACSATGGAGGAGGSIYITTAALSGSGTLTVTGGNSGSCDASGGGGRLAIYYTKNLSWTGTALDPSHAAAPGSAGANGANGTVYVTHTSGRSITMNSSAPGATSVTYEASIDVNTSTSIGGIVVDICDDTPVFGASSCAYPSNFDWGGATPTLTVNGGIGSGWTASGVQGGAAAGKSQVLELSNATPQSVTSSNSIDFSISTVTNPATSNHTFYARVVLFDTAAHMTSQYTVSGTARSGSLTNQVGNYGFALSTGNSGISLQFSIPEALTFCVSGSAIGSNCSSLTTPTIAIGHGAGGAIVVDTSQVDTKNIYIQTSTNAISGVVVRMKDTNSSATCAGLSIDNGATCGIPAVNTSCSGSCSAATITAGTAAIGACVSASTANVTVTAPYNGASCSTGGTNYGFDDATANGLRSTYGSQILSSGTNRLNQENDTLVFAATASTLTPAGTYSGTYVLVATGTF